MEEVERGLKGRTLEVYLYLQRKKQSGIREIQRDLGLSSPSVAEYQVDKLLNMGLAAKDSYGRVSVTKKVKVKDLDRYVTFGRFTVPRLAFYASFFSAVTVLYVVFEKAWSIYGLAVPAAAAAVLWFEAWKMRRCDPVRRAAREGERLWVALVPGMVALAVFVGASYFLLYHARAPDMSVPEEFGVAPYSYQVTPDDMAEIARLRAEAAQAGPSPTLPVTAMLFSGGLVVGFIAYLLVRYRCPSAVLAPEQPQN